MTKRYKVLLIIIFCALLISCQSGCATLRGKNLEEQALRNQIQVLEVQLRQKDTEIAKLQEDLEDAAGEKEELIERLNKTEAKPIEEIKTRPSVKQIQSALTNAGYNPGRIDGRMGQRTREAIRAFQKANGLIVDGRVGKQTWKLLKRYLYQKAK